MKCRQYFARGRHKYSLKYLLSKREFGALTERWYQISQIIYETYIEQGDYCSASSRVTMLRKYRSACVGDPHDQLPFSWMR
jgi:hypothetical protein